jgi:hypothetical protein
MLFDPDKPFIDELARLEREGKITTRLTAAQRAAIEASVRKYAANAAEVTATTMSEDAVRKVTEEMDKTILDLVNPQQVAREGLERTVTVGFNPATALEHLTTFLKDYSVGAMAERLSFALDVGAKIANGAGRFIQQNADLLVVDEYPAIELERLHAREVPRGFKRIAGGDLIPDPGQDWETRWRYAAEAAGDEDALRVLSETNRMVCLKSSDLLNQVAAGAGGFDDAIGNPYDPLWWNTGGRLMQVARQDAEALGLLDPGEPAKPSPLDLANLFAMPPMNSATHWLSAIAYRPSR